jgi:hypothetical protein
MAVRQLTEEELKMRYPPSIIEWEMKHGIMRYEKGGTTYVCCAKPFEQVCESIDKENEQIRTKLRLRELGLVK